MRQRSIGSARLLFALAVLGITVAMLAACGGSNPDSAAKLRHITDPLQGPLVRLNDAAANAKPSDGASIATLKATGQRVQEAVQTARGGLQDIGNSADSTRIRQLTALLNDLQSLSDALTADKTSASQLQVAGERARLATQDSATGLPTVDVSTLVAAMRGGHALTQNGVSAPVGGGSSSSGSSPQQVSYMDYTGPAFNAKLPTGGGWASPSQSQPTPGRLFRTNVRGPNGLFAIIDYTPTEAASFGGGNYQSRTQVGQTAFGSATKYVFQGGRLAECQRSTCVDYIVNDPNGTGGFGILAGGGDFASAAAIAQTIAESVTPSGP